MKLTGPQRSYLQFLETRRASIGEHAIAPQHIAMLRRMEERGLVARNINTHWRITDAGRRALGATHP